MYIINCNPFQFTFNKFKTGCKIKKWRCYGFIPKQLTWCTWCNFEYRYEVKSAISKSNFIYYYNKLINICIYMYRFITISISFSFQCNAYIFNYFQIGYKNNNRIIFSWKKINTLIDILWIHFLLLSPIL